MSKAQLIVIIFLLASSGPQFSYAEIHVVNVYDVAVGVSPVGMLNVVNLNAEIDGITNVSIRVVGTGGGGTFQCEGAIPDGWYDMDVKLAFGNGWYGFPTINQVGFDVIASELPSDPDPWSVCEETTQCVLPVTAYAHGTQYSECIATDYVLPVISHVELTITADSVVSVPQVFWGSIKARYAFDQ